MNTIVPLVKPFKSNCAFSQGSAGGPTDKVPSEPQADSSDPAPDKTASSEDFSLNPRGAGGESGTPIIRRPLHASGDYGDRWGVQAAPVSLPAHRQFQKNSCSPKRSLLPSGISEESNRRSSTRRNGKVARTPSQMVRGLTPIRRRSGSPCAFLSTLGRAASALPFSSAST